MARLADKGHQSAYSGPRVAVRARKPRRPQELRQGRRLDHRAASGRRQGFSSEGHRAGTKILARLSGGEKAWQGDMRTGMLGWRRICGIRSSPENFCSERSTKKFRSRSRLAKLFERWA